MLRDAVGDMPHLVTCIEVPCMSAADKAKAAAEASGEKLVSALVDAVDSQVSKVRNKAFSAYRTFWPLLLEQFVSIVCADNKHSIVICSPSPAPQTSSFAGISAREGPEQRGKGGAGASKQIQGSDCWLG